ncbi:MAG: type II toxin-antitoxin system PemK/MazF family toxin [Polyangiaceae bacterium]|nr:type II toxin-antitoxin system PemK/MazF family toxin [Polyangiaceae bacterium]MCW5792277.1 type II toxin-antitoxin system PemK/MazF family toxin [Polyangiaceae bacterium]
MADVQVAQGDVWWADLGEPIGSAPGFRRPVVVVQSNAFNDSALRTVLAVPLTTTLRHADVPGNVLLPARETRLPRDSVAVVSHVSPIDRTQLAELVGRVSRRRIEALFAGLDLVLGR